MKDQLNVLLITIDAVRPDHLGAYGYARAETPNIDRLSEGGLVFEQAISNGSYTKTAFPPILSSTYASMYGSPFAAANRGRPMVAPILKAQGYNTAGFTANPLLGAHVGYDMGFDVFEEPVPAPETRRWIDWKGAQRLLRSPVLNASLMKMGMTTVPHPVYVRGDEITDRACHWIASQHGKFFLWAHYMDAHWPYHIPGSLDTGRRRAQAWRDLAMMWKSRKSHPGDVVLQRVKRLYDAGIAYVDQQIGHLLRCLDAQSFGPTTAVIVTADHGEAFYEHGRWQHGAYFDFYDEVLRIPLIIKLPGQEKAQCIAQQVCTLDLVPTILDLLKIPLDPRMEGSTLLPVARGEGDLDTRPVITEMIDLKGWSCTAIRTPKFKYIYDERRPRHRDMYDLIADPGETRNVYGRHPDVEARLEDLLREHLGRTRGDDAGHEIEESEQSDEVVRRLRALGYLE